MKTLPTLLTAALVLGTTALFGTAQAGEQEAIDGCIDQLRSVGGADAQAGGQVLSSDLSEAATIVKLQDGGGTVWECRASSDGTIEDLKAVNAADDGEGAMAGSQSHEESLGGEQTAAAREACRAAVQERAGHGGITIPSAEFSEANTLVMLKDGKGAHWKCLSSNDGSTVELTSAD